MKVLGDDWKKKESGFADLWRCEEVDPGIHYQVCGVAWRQENSLPGQEDKNVSICVDMSTVRYVIITIMLFPDLVLWF